MILKAVCDLADEDARCDAADIHQRLARDLLDSDRATAACNPHSPLNLFNLASNRPSALYTILRGAPTLGIVQKSLDHLKSARLITSRWDDYTIGQTMPAGASDHDRRDHDRAVKTALLSLTGRWISDEELARRRNAAPSRIAVYAPTIAGRCRLEKAMLPFPYNVRLG